MSSLHAGRALNTRMGSAAWKQKRSPVRCLVSGSNDPGGFLAITDMRISGLWPLLNKYYHEIAARRLLCCASASAPSLPEGLCAFFWLFSRVGDSGREMLASVGSRMI